MKKTEETDISALENELAAVGFVETTSAKLKTKEIVTVVTRCGKKILICHSRLGSFTRHTTIVSMWRKNKNNMNNQDGYNVGHLPAFAGTTF